MLTSKLTPLRLANAFRLWTSYQQARKGQPPVPQGLPMSLSIEPTTACNLRCPECPSGLRSFTRPTGKISPVTFEKIIDELHKTLIYLTFYFQGEPYLHPQFTDMVHYAHRKRIYTATSTNAHFLNLENAEKTVKSGLDKLIISIDGTSQETYEAYRKGGKLQKVIEGTRNMVLMKKKLRSKTPHLVFQFLVVRPNEHQITEVRKLTKEMGVNELQLKTAQIYDYQNGSALLPTDPHFSRYALQNDGTFRIKNDFKDECWRMWQGCVITWDGRVVPCCFDKDAHHVLGNVLEEDFKTIWQSSEYQQFRTQLFNNRSQIEICKNCTEGTRKD